MSGEIGCYMSHIGVWRSFLDSQYEIALVLEDDVVFHKDFLVDLHEAVKSSTKWDMLKLNKIRAKFPVSQLKIGDYQLSAFAGSFTGMSAYLVNWNCAEHLLLKMLPIRRPIDHELDYVDLQRFRHFALQPFPSSFVDQGLSTITGSAFGNVKKFPIYKRHRVYGNRGRALATKSFRLLMGKL